MRIYWRVILIVALWALWPLAHAAGIPAEAGKPTAKIIDIATDETDSQNLHDAEPSIAVNPVNPLEIAVVTFSEPWRVDTMAPVWKSSDGGATWRKVFQIPRPTPNALGPDDQNVFFDAEGRLYIAEQNANAFRDRDYIFRQEDGPDDPLTVGVPYGYDQPFVSVDTTRTSACFGRLYSPWLNFSVSPERSSVSNSVDGGATLTNIGVGINVPFPNRTTRVAVAPDGKVYVIYKTREGGTMGPFQNSHFYVHRSDDCGMTWDALGSPGVSVHGPDAVQTFFTTAFGNPARGKVGRARSSDAWIAVNRADGAVYAAYVSRDDSGFGQIYVARSTDQGVTWNSNPVTDGTHHSAFPEIAVADNGTVGVLYVDYDDSGPRTIFRHRFARSFDNGITWTDQILQNSDPTPLPNARNGFLWGDFNALTAFGDTFYGVFTGDSIDRAVAQYDPILFTETAEPAPGQE